MGYVYVTRKQLSITLCVISLGIVGATYELNHNQIESTNENVHSICLAVKDGRVQGNVRAKELREVLGPVAAKKIKNLKVPKCD